MYAHFFSSYAGYESSTCMPGTVHRVCVAPRRGTRVRKVLNRAPNLAVSGPKP